MRFLDNLGIPGVTDPNDPQPDKVDPWERWNAVKDKSETWQTVTLHDGDEVGREIIVFNIKQTTPGRYEGGVEDRTHVTQTTPGEAPVKVSCVPVSFTEKQIFSVVIKPVL